MEKTCRRGGSVRQGGLALGLLGAVALLLSGATSPVQAGPCGPGLNWVGTCAAGSDHFEALLKLWVDFDFDFVSDIELRLKGPVWIDRGDPMDNRKINTEIVSLSAAGSDPLLGRFTVMAGSMMGLPPSTGMIIEKDGMPDCPFVDPTQACSFFDVFHKIQIAGMTLQNVNPIRVEAMIDRVPPLTFAGNTDCAQPNVYCFEGAVPLFDDQGTPRAQIIHVVHIPVPEPSTLLLLGSGLAGLVGLEIRRRRQGKKA